MGWDCGGLCLIGITGGLYGVLPGWRGGLWYTGEGRFTGRNYFKYVTEVEIYFQIIDTLITS